MDICYYDEQLFFLSFILSFDTKVRGLAPFGVELEFLIEEYAGSRGSFPPKAKRKKYVLCIYMKR